jgi:hypothetical protein
MDFKTGMGAKPDKQKLKLWGERFANTAIVLIIIFKVFFKHYAGAFVNDFLTYLLIFSLILSISLGLMKKK